MEIGSEAWSRLLVDGAASLGVALAADHIRMFARYAEELLKWTRITNLTTITRPEDIARNHFLDSLVPAGLIAPESELLDVGSGGGFPGLPLHLVIPGLHTSLVDSARKKVSFLRHVIRELEIERIEAVQARVEELPRRPGRARRFDVIISRAFSAAAPFVAAALPLLKPHGRIITLKGEMPESERLELAAAAGSGSFGALLSLEPTPYCLPGSKRERTLLVISRNERDQRPVA